MSWVTVIWSMVASASLTLAVIQLLVWCKRRTAWANLLLSLTAVATAGLSAFELWMMRAQTPEEYGLALRWIHVPGLVCILSLVGFVRLYLQAGRPWLAWAVCGLRTLSLFLNFYFTPNLNYRQITSLRHIRFLGESVSVAQGVPNPWMLIGQTSMLLLVVFVLDASITVWQRGDRRQALSLGGAILFFSLAAMLQMVLVLWGVILTPLTFSLFFLGIIAAMSYELSRDVLRAAQLSVDLRESEHRFQQVAETAAEFIWEVNTEGLYTYASPSVESTLGYTAEELVEKKHFYDLFDPTVRDAHKAATFQAFANRQTFRELPNSNVTKSGRIVHLETSGSPVLDAAGKLLGYRGADTDVTERRYAEAAARELAGRLINAQESERSRIARDLHDDFSQRLALISIELELIGQKPPSQPDAISVRMQELSGLVKSLSSEVHRLAHELHPSKLDQLGLTAALHGFCNELAAAHEIAIEFEPQDVPRALPNEVALCLYRITQEALQNVVKHSGASGAKVALAAHGQELHLTVADDGSGFDAGAGRSGSSLGIVSMRERVRMVQGQIYIQSRPGQGTRVEVRVPMATPAGVGES